MADNREHVVYPQYINVIVDMRHEWHKLEDIADVLKIPR
jgi:hypothetical protein